MDHTGRAGDHQGGPAGRSWHLSTAALRTSGRRLRARYRAGRMTVTQGRTSEPQDGGSRPVSQGRATGHSTPVLGHRRYVCSEGPQTEGNSQRVLLGAVSPCFSAGHSTSCDGTFQNPRGMQEEPLGEASKGKRWPGQDGSLGVRWASASFFLLRRACLEEPAVQIARPASCPRWLWAQRPDERSDLPTWSWLFMCPGPACTILGQ